MHESTPLVSVVLPVFNGASTLERAVTSLLDQSLPDLEIIAADDGSTDHSVALLDALHQGDPRLQVLRGPHRGLVPTLNVALSRCRGPLIARMDADDWSDPERLARQVEFLSQHPEVDLVSSRIRITRQDGAPVAGGMQRYEEWLNGLLTPEAIRLQRFVESPIVHPSVLGRRRVFEGGYREGPFPEDYDLWLRCLNEGCSFAKVPEVLLQWTDSSHRLTRTHPAYGELAFRALKIRALQQGPLAGRSRVAVWGAGPIGKGWMLALQAVGYQVPWAVDLSPRKIGQRIHGALVIHPDDLSEVRREEVLLLAVGVQGARREIQTWLEERGFREGEDYWAVA